MAVQAPGRLNLIDSFCTPTPILLWKPELVSNVASLTAQMQNLTREVESFAVQMQDTAPLNSKLTSLMAEENRLLQTTGSTQDKQQQLRFLTNRASRISVATDAAERTTATLQSFLRKFQTVGSFPPIVETLSGIFDASDLFGPAREDVDEALKVLTYASGKLESALVKARAVTENLRLARQPLDLQARQLRSEIEGFQQGAGAISREASAILEKLTQLASLEALRADRNQRILGLQNERGRLLDLFDSDADEVFARVLL